MTNSKPDYKVKVNEFEFSFTREQIEAADIVQKSPDLFHHISNHRSVTATIHEVDRDVKALQIEVEGENFQVQIKDELDQMLDQMGFSAVSNKQIKEIKAPMPGLVLEIAVTEGQEVQEGDKILILVAMKMENSILIHTNATIKRIAVKPGQAVEKGQVLVELA